MAHGENRSGKLQTPGLPNVSPIYPNMYSELIGLFPTREFELVCLSTNRVTNEGSVEGGRLRLYVHMCYLRKRSTDIDKTGVAKAALQVVSRITDWL